MRRVKRKKTMRYHTASPVAPFTPPTAAEQFNAERVRPLRDPGIESDVLVPFLWGFGSMILVCPLSLYAAWYLELPYHFAIPVTFIAAAGSSMAMLIVTKQTMQVRETIWVQDGDNDGTDEKPAIEASYTLKNADGYRETKRGTFNLDYDNLRTWAKHATSGDSIAINRWTGSGGLFERGEYEEFLQTLKQMGLADVGKGRKGWQLTIAGQDYFGEFLNE